MSKAVYFVSMCGFRMLMVPSNMTLFSARHAVIG